MASKTTATLFQNAIIVSMDPSIGVKHNCDVLVEGNQIAKVEPNITLPRGTDTKIVDASTSILCPGFIDCHHHLWQQLLRSIATDWSLADYLAVIRNCYGSLFTPEDVYLSNYVACLDLLNHGITTVVDHCHIINSAAHADAAIKALKDSKIRGVFCYGFYDNPPLRAPHTSLSTASSNFTFASGAKFEDAKRCRELHFSGSNSWEDNLLTFGLAPNEFETLPASQLRDEIDFGRKLGSTIITGHVAMGRYDMGADVVGNLASTNYLKPDLLFSHGASWTNDDCKKLAACNCGVVSTPDTDLQMGMGHPVAFRARDHGCRVGLGIDVTCNQGNDMVAQGRLVLQAERSRNNEDREEVPTTIKRKTEEVLRMMTLGGAEAMGIEHLTGSITPGKRADLVVIKCEDLNIVPVGDPIGTIVFNSNPSNIDAVLVDGRFVKESGKVVAIGGEFEKMRHEITERSMRLINDADRIMPKEAREGVKTAIIQAFGAAAKGQSKI